MSFTTTQLVGSRVLVKGTDAAGTENQTVLDSTQWEEVSRNTAYSQAESDFDTAVETFFAPLLEAAEKLDQKMTKPDDPASYVVLEEPVVGVAAQPGHLIRLNHDSVVLRLIEQGDTSRLVWVGDDLEVAEAVPAAPPVDEAAVLNENDE